MKRIACPALAAVLLAPPLLATQPAGEEKEVWSLEDTYWRYVQSNDLDRYRTLWHSDFLGWPLTNPEPTRKEHSHCPYLATQRWSQVANHFGYGRTS